MPGCPGTHSVDQAGLQLRNLPASASQVLGLQACATTAWLSLKSLRGFGLTQGHTHAELVHLTLRCNWCSFLILSPIFLNTTQGQYQYVLKQRKKTLCCPLQFQTVLFFVLLLLLLFSRQGFSVQPWLSWNSLCRPGWPQTQKSACLCLPCAGIKGVRHHHPAQTVLF